MPKLKIAITGPESTGKSTLASQLSQRLDAELIPETARSYIQNLSRPYEYEDLLEISELQKKTAKRIIHQNNELVIADTSLLTLEIWSKDKFKKCDSWILEQVQKERFDLYLLCNVDIPWEFDEQREDEYRRSELFELYEFYLKKYNFNYEIISGLGEIRLQNALIAIDSHKSEK